MDLLDFSSWCPTCLALLDFLLEGMDFYSWDRYEFGRSQSLNNLPKLIGVQSEEHDAKPHLPGPTAQALFSTARCARGPSPPSLTLVGSHTHRCVLITQQCKTLYVVCYFISRNMVHSLHYRKQLCVYLGSKCYLVVSSMGYFVSSITFLFSLSIRLLDPM